MSDGAHLGVGAERALETVLGGKEQPRDDERMSDEEFAAWIRSADKTNEYGETARYAARLIVEFLEAHPEHLTTPGEAEGAFQVDGREATREEVMSGAAKFVRLRDGLYEVMETEGVYLGDLDLTGFMWGWAFNAARKVLGLGPVPNPAIVEIG